MDEVHNIAVSLTQTYLHTSRVTDADVGQNNLIEAVKTKRPNCIICQHLFSRPPHRRRVDESARHLSVCVSKSHDGLRGTLVDKFNYLPFYSHSKMDLTSTKTHHALKIKEIKMTNICHLLFLTNNIVVKQYCCKCWCVYCNKAILMAFNYDIIYFLYILPLPNFIIIHIQCHQIVQI